MEFSYISLFIFLLLFIPMFLVNRVIGIKINRQMLISALRMIIQLSLVGFYLKYIFQWNNPVINGLYLIVMIVIASIHSIKSSSLKLKSFLLPILMAVAIPQILTVALFNFLAGGIENLLTASLIIPVGGMLLGNCLNGNIIAINSFYKGISDNEKKYNLSLLMGASHYQSINPYLTKSMELSIKPSIASMATTGLVTLPGMMTGQILAGSLPVTAVKYQAAILIAILFAKYFSTLLALILSSRRGFTRYRTLNRALFTKL